MEVELPSPVGPDREGGVGSAADQVDRGEIVAGSGEDEAAPDLQVAETASGWQRLGAGWTLSQAGDQSQEDSRRDGLTHSNPGSEKSSTSSSETTEDLSPGRPVVHHFSYMAKAVKLCSIAMCARVSSGQSDSCALTDSGYGITAMRRKSSYERLSVNSCAWYQVWCISWQAHDASFFCFAGCHALLWARC